MSVGVRVRFSQFRSECFRTRGRLNCQHVGRLSAGLETTCVDGSGLLR
jgi:hypothetical protein